MKGHLLLFILLWAAIPMARGMEIFACEPEWAALATELGGDAVNAFSATTAMQDVHYVQARPSLIARMRRADLVVCSGSGLEAGWLPLLLRRAGNPKVQPGTPGYLEAAHHVPLLEIPAVVDRAKGDVHPEGNPHVHLHPENILRVARVLAERMAAIGRGGAVDYEARLADFEARWNRAMERWSRDAEPLHALPVVVHHRAWSYLAEWLSLEIVGELEPRPGVPPTASHLGRLIEDLRGRPARVILRAPYNEGRPSAWLSKKTGIPAVVLPYTVGGTPKASDLFGLFDDTLARLLSAVG